MTHLETWERLLTLYRESSRFSLWQEQGKRSVLWWLLALYGVVALTSVLLSYWKDWFVLPLAAIVGTAWLVDHILIRRLFLPDAIDCKHLSLSERERQARFQRFRLLVRDTLPEAIEQAEALVEWHRIHGERYARIRPITHPIALLVLASVLALFFSSEIIQQSAIEMAVLIGVIVLTVIYGLDTAIDIRLLNEQASFEVCRFLRWLMLEREGKK